MIFENFSDKKLLEFAKESHVDCSDFKNLRRQAIKEYGARGYNTKDLEILFDQDEKNLRQRKIDRKNRKEENNKWVDNWCRERIVGRISWYDMMFFFG